MNSVAASAVGNDFRSQLGGKSVVAILVTADASAGDAELLSQRHALMTLGAALGSNSRIDTGSFRWGLDLVNAMTVGAGWRSGHTSQHSLTVNTLHKLGALSLVALTAGSRNIDFGD